jgi:hypothetical protein
MPCQSHPPWLIMFGEECKLWSSSCIMHCAKHVDYLLCSWAAGSFSRKT